MAALPLQTRWRDTKALLFQAVPPLDLAYSRDGLKNAFIIAQNTSAAAIGELRKGHRPAAVLIGMLVLGRLQTDYSRSWTNTGIGVRVHSSVAVWGPGLWQAATPSRRARREGASPVLVKEMNDFVFVLDLIGEELLRMANSVSAKVMTWPWFSVAPCFVIPPAPPLVCESSKTNEGDVSITTFCNGNLQELNLSCTMLLENVGFTFAAGGAVEHLLYSVWNRSKCHWLDQKKTFIYLQFSTSW